MLKTIITKLIVYFKEVKSSFISITKLVMEGVWEVLPLAVFFHMNCLSIQAVLAKNYKEAFLLWLVGYSGGVTLYLIDLYFKNRRKK